MESSRDQDRESLIREKAYAIWLEEGRPEGRADDHWRRASEALVADEEAVAPLQARPDVEQLLPPNH